MTTRMTALQRVFMRLEQQDYPMDTMGIFVLEPGPCGPLDYDTVRAHLDQQVRAIPAFTRQQSHSLRGIAEEGWMRTTAFDIHDHLASVSAPPPGDVRALRDLAVALSKTPLDRRRPLWKAWYVEGGADGTTALLLRVHLAVTERLGGMSVENALFTPAPRGVDRSMLPPPLEGDPYPTEAQMVARGVLELVGSGLATGRELAVVAGQQARHRLKVRGRAARRAQAAATLPGNRRAPKTLLDGAHRTPAKSLAVASLPRADIAAITARCPGLTSTDVILAVVAGGVRAYLERYDHVPDRPLRTACPMFVPADAHGEDPFTVVLMSLPVDVADRAERVATIHRRNARRIRRYEGAKPGNRALVGVGDASHPTLVATLSSLMSTGAASLLPAWINLTVGVFRSSDEPLYFADAKVAHVYGRTLVVPPQRVFIHAALYDRWVEIGVTALRDLLREPGTLLAMMREELAAIGELAADGGLAAHLGA
ncbi:MAG: DUF1298 domain-containing protein [Austwickia sp.]|nr:DUF1298 domain-containing protein [Austwickia sp.]